MSEIINETVQDEDFDFEQALEDSCKLVRRGQRVEGVVTSIKPNEVVVDIGTKHTGFIPLDELSDDSTAKAEDLVKVGETLILIVTKVQDLEGFVTLSKKRIDSEKGMDDLVKGAEEGTIFDAYVSEIVNKGLVAMVQGVRVFIPASQATLRRGEQYEQLVHTHQKIKIIEADPKRRRAIGSIRAILDVENAAKRDEFWNSVEVGSRYSGAVKSLTSYGAFVDLGGVDGMIHISELSWGRIKSPSEILKVGDIVDVYVKDIDVENKKISLGYRKEEDNPWNAIQDYPIGSEFEAPVVSVTKFGAFVRILPGIDGLVHI
ncbi:MAG: S1 RNA-binding domain-containing protein, partial [Oscillospiraceae bacterium]